MSSEEFISELTSSIDSNNQVIVIRASDPSYAVYEVDRICQEKKQDLCIWRDDAAFDPERDFKPYNPDRSASRFMSLTKEDDTESSSQFGSLIDGERGYEWDYEQDFHKNQLPKLTGADDIHDTLEWLQKTPLNSLILCLQWKISGTIRFSYILNAFLKTAAQDLPSEKKVILIMDEKDFEEEDNNEACLTKIEECAFSLLSTSPSPSYLRQQFCEVMKKLEKPLPSEATINTIVRAATGMSGPEIRAFTRRFACKYDLNDPATLQRIEDERFKSLCPDGLKYLPRGDMPLSEVGGLSELKAWINTHKNLYSKEAKEFGLDTPKGILLVGPPGTGKSIAPMYLAKSLHIPMFYFHPEDCMSRFVSVGEQKCRQIFEAIDQLPPCIIYLDEVEKFFSNIGHISTHESTQRLFGLWIEWLSNRTSEAIVVASSNRLTHLPPELSRPGRFDQIFYVGLPDLTSREEIFNIHLKRRKHGDSFSKEDIHRFAELTEGYSPAEIEQVVKNALLKAYSRDKVLRSVDVIQSAVEITPLSKSRENELRDLCEAGMKLGTPAGGLSEFEKKLNNTSTTVMGPYLEWDPSYC